MRRLTRTAETARFFDASQLGYWVLRTLQERVRPRMTSDCTDMSTAAVAAVDQTLALLHENDHASRERAQQVLNGRFRFLEHEERLFTPEWSGRYVSDLWSFHLHYFDYGVDLALAARNDGDAAAAARFAELALSWMDAARSSRVIGWQAYPLAVRTINWMHALVLLREHLPVSTRLQLEHATYAQLLVLERRLELHRRGNHLQKNLEALALGGLLFDGGAARRWRSFAVPKFWELLESHFLADGGHYERSTMYHSHCLRDAMRMVVIADALDVPVPASSRHRLSRAWEAWCLFTRPDGRLHAFGDGAESHSPGQPLMTQLGVLAFGRTPTPPVGSFSMVNSGYFGWFEPNGTRLIVDCGDTGAREQPAHGHCDMLSYELDVGGVSVVVDAGTSGYGGDPLREYCRSTRAHNTVQVGPLEQSEVWGTFRIGRMARPVNPEVVADGSGWHFVGGCRMYDGSATHHRKITLRGSSLRVRDCVEGGHGLTVASFIHLHPLVQMESELTFVAGRYRLSLEPHGVSAVTLASGWFSGRMGEAVAAPVLILTLEANDGSEFGYLLRWERRGLN
jgi:uncharacterized heparinase superfamily protein